VLKNYSMEPQHYYCIGNNVSSSAEGSERALLIRSWLR
jgi:hypothetical protein